VTEFPNFAAMWRARQQSTARPRLTPQAVTEVEYADLQDAAQECDLFLRYTEGQPQQFTERFMTAASPGIVATAMGNAYYDSY
jgi:5-methyltetrahydropteroyltriglutamate--homocysteine methyltransferase